MRIFGIDPGSQRTGYGCVDAHGRELRLVCFGIIAMPPRASLPDKLHLVFDRLQHLLTEAAPDIVAVENVFHAINARTALVLGQARGAALVAAADRGLGVAEYTPAAIKRTVVGYGRAEKVQVQHMVKLLLGLERAPSPHDAADALAVAICHAHSCSPWGRDTRPAPARTGARGWRRLTDRQLAGLGRGTSARGSR